MSLLDTVLQDCQEQGLVKIGSGRVLVACSGGADSIFLLYALWALRETLGWDVHVSTVDHGLRANSDADARFVQQIAWTLGLPCEVTTADVAQARKAGESIEMAARRIRREIWTHQLVKYDANAVALAHHMDDQAETLLLRLTRGTSLRGLGGMSWISRSGPLTILRPLLGVRRHDIEQFLRSHGRPWREDPSNKDLNFRRNRVRHELVPLLVDRFNPSSVEHLNSLAAWVRDDDAVLSDMAAEAVDGVVVGDRLDLTAWRALPPALGRRVLFHWLEKIGVQQTGDWALAVRRVERWLHDDTEMFPCLTVGDTCLLQQAAFIKKRPDPLPRLSPQSLVVPGHLTLPDIGREILVEEETGFDPLACDIRDLEEPLTGYICQKKLNGSPLTIRAVRPGDRYRPLHGKGTRKVQDVLVDLKVPRNIRPQWPLVCCGEELVWVPGARVAESWGLPNPRAESLRLTFRFLS